MGISAMMRTSASGMEAQSNRLGTVADNIANVNTTGYKRADTEFSSFIPMRATSEYVSGSVTTHVRNAISEQGVFKSTTSATDLAINGNGFFVVSDNDGTPFLTRAGSFVKNGDGELVNGAGYYLMGYALANGDPSVVANGIGGLERVTISDLALQAVPSPSAPSPPTFPPMRPSSRRPICRRPTRRRRSSPPRPRCWPTPISAARSRSTSIGQKPPATPGRSQRL